MGKRILVADDSLTIQRAFSMVLAGSEFELSFTKSVETGLAALRRATKPDLILADINLGSESGYDFCSMVKADSSTRKIPVYILASEQTPYDESRGRRVGADGCLVKPFDSQALIDSLNQALAAPTRDVLETKPTPGVVTADSSRTAPKEAISPSPSEADDDYSEMVIERAPSPPPPSAWNARPAPRPSAVPPASTSPAPPNQPSFGAPRPSLIPGARPSAGGNFGRPPAPPQPSAPVALTENIAKQVANRTIMGLPMVRPPVAPPLAPPPPVSRQMPAVITPPVGAVPVAPFIKPTSISPIPQHPLPRSSSPPPHPGMDPSQVTRRVPTPFPPTTTASPAPIVSTAVDRTMEAIAARGSEYAAIAKLSREVIEQVVWEVVPELAEVIIRQEIDRLVSAKK